MATTDAVLTEVRYDLRDTASSLYTDTELFYYGNRALIQLDNVLSAMAPDWVYNEANVTLAPAASSAAVPTGCIMIRSAWISTTQLVKKSPEQLYREKKYIGAATGEPYWFAEVGANMQFDRTADTGYTVVTYYDKRATALATGASMPYSDHFNGMIKEMIITLAHKRNEVNVFPDTAIYNFFMEKLMGRIIGRNHVPVRSRLDF